MESKDLSCKCTFLDGRDIDVSVGKCALGSDLFNSVCNYLNIKNRNIFGLIHKGGSYNPAYRWWIRMDKPLKKQVSGKCRIWAFALVVKFYPTENVKSLEDIARYHSTLQVREDLLAGRLCCPTNTRALLLAYSAQSEQGEYKSDTLDRQLMEGLKFVGAGSKSADAETELECEEEMIKTHQSLKQMSAAEADIKFLRLAASLPKYGCHFYPALEVADNDGDQKVKSCHHVKVCVGIGRKGFYVQTDKNRNTYKWHSILSVMYKKNFLILKILKNTKSTRLQFDFENSFQCKSVWKAAIDMHVHFRVEANQPEPEEGAVEVSKKYVIFGKKQVKFAASPKVLHASQLNVSSPGSVRRSRTSLHRPDVDRQKEAEVKPNHIKVAKSSPALSHLSHRKNHSPFSNRRITPVSTPKTQPKKMVEQVKTPETVPKKLNDIKVASAIPARLRCKDGHAEISADEYMSDHSDNTDVLCSRNIVEKAFSYAEKDGVNSIHSWLELCSSREDASERGRPVSRSAPSSRRCFSLRRPSPDGVMDLDDYRPLIKSKHPVAIKSQDRRNLSPNISVHYEDERGRRLRRRVNGGRSFCGDNHSEPAKVRHRHIADIYQNEYRRTLGKHDTQRRARSMYSLAPPFRERSTSRDRCSGRHHSPSATSVCTDYGCRFRHSCVDCAAFSNTNVDKLPYESEFTKRIVSQSRLNDELGDRTGDTQSLGHLRQDAASSTALHNEAVPAYDYPDETALMRDYKAGHETHNTFPAFPRFVRSVR